MLDLLQKNHTNIEVNNPIKIRGWLYLVGLYLFILLFIESYDFISSFHSYIILFQKIDCLFTKEAGKVSILLAKAMHTYDIVSLILSSVFVVMIIFNYFLFFKKAQAFKKNFILLLAFKSLTYLIIYFVARLIKSYLDMNPDFALYLQSSYRDYFLSIHLSASLHVLIIQCVIPIVFISYIVYSKRVKQTFIS